MSSIRSFVSAAFVVGAAAAGLTAMTAEAHAETAFSGNVALTSDYVFRGISQSDGGPAISGGFDAVHGILYAGVWASSIDFGAEGTLELDGYFGVRPTLGPVSLDFGAIYYSYPGIDDAANANMWELKAAGSIAPIEGLTLGAAIFYSPEFTFSNDADAVYAEANAAYTISEIFAVSGAVGRQEVDAAGYYLDANDGDETDSYTTWNLGVAASYWGFAADLRYSDTDLGEVALIGPSGDVLSDERVVLTLKRAL